MLTEERHLTSSVTIENTKGRRICPGPFQRGHREVRILHSGPPALHLTVAPFQAFAAEQPLPLSFSVTGTVAVCPMATNFEPPRKAEAPP